MKGTDVRGSLLVCLLGACAAPPVPAPTPKAQPVQAPEPAEPAAPVIDNTPQTDWYDLRFISRDPNNPIRMIGPDGETYVPSQTRTRQKEHGYLLPAGANGVLRVRLKAHRFYLAEDTATEETINYGEERFLTDLIRGCEHRIIGKIYDRRTNGYAETQYGRFYKINGKPVELSFASSDPTTMIIKRERDTADKIVFKRLGTARLLVRLDSKELAQIPLEVVPSPVHVGMTNEELLNTLGFPSYEATVDRRYVATGNGRTVTKHALYKAFPELVVTLDSERRVVGWHSHTEHSSSTR